jgi:hypothetical protein
MESISTQLNHMEHALAQSINPVSNLTSQFNCATISNTQAAPPTTPQHQFPQQPNHAYQIGLCLSSVTMEDEKAIVQTNMMKYLHYPSTPKGHMFYFDQLHTWKAAYSENAYITINTLFLLQPGTVLVCSGECYTCGMQGH